MSEFGKCATCPNKADKYSSGTPECWQCWNWRKLDGPASRYWIERLGQAHKLLAEQVDLYDVKTWTKWGILEQVEDLFQYLENLKTLYEAQLQVEQERRGYV